MDDEALINTLSIVQKDFEKKPMPDTEYIIKELNIVKVYWIN